ncbi:replication protein A 70 kDa DNA-binding subunit [Diachasma alloeum]|uniref:replication protein A 70 kDa DNA-binding subunit n=1 Tax=Diachasma alloeum TaxID=454923 RepID=UPI0007381C61|nr:replication protein A 70 kDa DNA-binding subunit [Diachasma alloeum]
MTLPGLTKGALLKIYQGQDIDKPICQVLGLKKLGNGDRYRVLISDSLYISSFTMLATQLNHIIDEGTLADFSIIEIGRYVLSQANNGGKPRRIMIILEVTQKAAGADVGGKIGNPVPVEKHISSDNGVEESPDAAAPGSAVKRPAAAPVSRVPEKRALNNTINSGTHISTTPIGALSPYQNRWVIKARVSSKSAIRTWSNSRGEGKLFNMDLLDESGEIRCTAFREAVDKFYDIIEVGKVYYISRCQLKPANKAFNNLHNDYEMSMTNDTEIIPCDDTADDIPMINFDFKGIEDIEKYEKGEIVDILGVVKQVDEVQSLTKRSDGTELRKRDVHMIDMSNMMITLTLWGTQAESFDGSNHPVIAVKGARLGEFNGGKSLSTLSSSVIQVDPDLPEAHRLRGWWTTTGHSAEAKSISRGIGGGSMAGSWMNIGAAFAAGTALTMSNTETYLCKAAVTFIRSENAIYKACPTDTCNKKVVDHEGCFRCEKCNRDFPNFKYRLLAQINISDHTGSIWATAFSGEAEKMLGMTAQELGELADQDRDTYLTKCASISFSSYIFKIRMKLDNYLDDVRLRSVIASLAPVDYTEYNSQLLKQLKADCNIARISSE